MLFMEDLGGDVEHPPRHAKAFGDMLSIRNQLRAERDRALGGHSETLCRITSFQIRHIRGQWLTESRTSSAKHWTNGRQFTAKASDIAEERANMNNRNVPRGIMTTATHAGEQPDPTTGASAPALHMSSTFVTDQVAGFSGHDIEDEAIYLNARAANANVRALEAKNAALENTEDCLCLASGMAASTSIFLTFLSAGDHVVVSDVI